MSLEVLHVNCNYMDSWLHQTMIDELNAKGIENKVFVPVYKREGHVVLPKDYVNVAVCFKKWDRILYQYKQSKIYNELRNDYKFEKFSILHAYTAFTDGNVTRRLAKEYGLPYVVAVRNTDVNNFFKYMPHLRSIGVSVLKDAKAVFFLSSKYMEQTIGQYIPKILREEIREKSYIIPNGIDDFWHNNLYLPEGNVRHKRIISDKKIRLIYAGGIDKNKNVLLTVDAIKLLKREGWNVEFTIVGKVKSSREFSKLKKYDFIHYIEPQPKEKLIKIYRENDIFVMPSHTESFGLVYGEAISQGLPVVYTRGQGFDGQFKDGLVGYPTSDVDAVELKNTIIKIANNYETIARDIALYSSKFKWDDICKQYLSVYNSII